MYGVASKRGLTGEKNGRQKNNGGDLGDNTNRLVHVVDGASGTSK